MSVPLKAPHAWWSASGNDLVPLVLGVWDRSDMPHEITEREHADREAICSTVNQWWLEMGSEDGMTSATLGAIKH